MTVNDLINRNRSYRRFDESYEISEEILQELVDLARRTPSGANKQPLKYKLIQDKPTREKIFPNLAWAGYLQDWEGPLEGERPTAYIAIMLDKNISHSPGVDHGITAQTILLGAVEKGLGGCIIASLKKLELASVLGLRDNHELLLVIALGKPVENIKLETIDENGDIRYYRDEQGVHHVPKRSLDSIILA